MACVTLALPMHHPTAISQALDFQQHCLIARKVRKSGKEKVKIQAFRK